jgi:predicted RNase H-like HicB family nuclease
MKIVKAIYREEPDGAWIGSSSAYPGFIGHGDSYKEAKKRLQEGLPFFAEENDMLIVHVITAAERADSGARQKVELGITAEPRTIRYHRWFADEKATPPAAAHP